MDVSRSPGRYEAYPLASKYRLSLPQKYVFKLFIVKVRPPYFRRKLLLTKSKVFAWL